MKKIFLILSFSAAVSLGLGVFLFSKSHIQSPPAACAEFSFDYETYISAVKSSKSHAEKRATALASSQPGTLEGSQLEYYNAKIPALEAAEKIVREYVLENGSSFSCFEDGHHFFMGELNFPTFSEIERERELEFLIEHIKQEGPPVFLTILQIILGPVIALIVGILAFIKKES